MSNTVSKEACLCCFDSNTGNKLVATSGSHLVILLVDNTMIKGIIKSIEIDTFTMTVEDIINGSIDSKYFGEYIIGNVYRFKIGNMAEFMIL